MSLGIWVLEVCLQIIRGWTIRRVPCLDIGLEGGVNPIVQQSNSIPVASGLGDEVTGVYT